MRRLSLSMMLLGFVSVQVSQLAQILHVACACHVGYLALALRSAGAASLGFVSLVDVETFPSNTESNHTIAPQEVTAVDAGRGGIVDRMKERRKRREEHMAARMNKRRDALQPDRRRRNANKGNNGGIPKRAADPDESGKEAPTRLMKLLKERRDGTSEGQRHEDEL
mmetsp:Transcript_19793/g.40199  ORF Transcript_19793/g.40199 Transcript_19793/m.40199 type:complete len:167 (+) Transcript_19793:668-1168(+)